MPPGGSMASRTCSPMREPGPKRKWPRLGIDLYASLQGGLKMEVVGMIAEDDRVAAEIRSYATTKTGKIYENDYHMIFRIRAGKIAEVKEYTDLMHATEIFG
ncbi:nuclear transport factor 2 family protein [Salinicola peritrichatus]|uniref:nuclear transport factor 2 family protein n=1 Tax=Salinicola peritrichatus TaxID=1267424 RepID=UPI0030B820A0